MASIWVTPSSRSVYSLLVIMHLREPKDNIVASEQDFAH